MAFFGGIVAILASVLRVSAYMHWMTDVLAGAFIGCAIGYCVPILMFKDSKECGKSVTAAPVAEATPQSDNSVDEATVASV
jgi:membrane-associated phospholipid phosphatase